MHIESISYNDKKATITMSATELVWLGNALSEYICHENETKSGDLLKYLYRLNRDLIIVRDITQYGCLDNFSLDCINKCRKGEK